MTTGDVQVNGLPVPGTSVIFSGNLITSERSTSNLQFSDGTSAVLNPGASMTVYREHSVLQHGVTMQRGVDKHPILADGLRISGSAPNAVALVGVKDESYVEVAAQAGETEVWTSSGNLVARVEPGKTLSFALQDAPANTSNTVKLCGVLQQNHEVIDEYSNVAYQLQGSGLDAQVGKTIRIVGTLVPGTGSATIAQVVTVSSVKRLNRSCLAAGAAPAITTGAIVLLVFVAIGGSLLGLGLAGTFSSGAHTPVTPATP
jgi:hypothetical protein